MPILHDGYIKKGKDELTKKYNYSNHYQIPKIEKVVLNMGVGKSVQDSKVINKAFDELQLISGQKPVITKAKKSIAGFKLREGMSIGCKVTLRGVRMQEFIDRLVMIALPRVRDFRGLSSKSFDGKGNYTFGIKEQIVFPEIDYDKIDQIRGFDICVVTTANTDEEAKELLQKYRFPFIN